MQHYEYVFPADAIDVYDMDNGMRLVKSISLPGATDIRGAVASPSTHTLYVSYGGDGGAERERVDARLQPAHRHDHVDAELFRGRRQHGHHP